MSSLPLPQRRHGSAWSRAARRLHLFGIVFVGVALLGVVYPVVGAPRAEAQASCAVVFNYTGAVVEFTIPDGITQIGVDIYGAAGGDATGGTGVPNINEGGFGAGVTGGVLPVVAGDVMTVIVGGEGGPAVADEPFNPGGTGGFGYDGVGGGASGGDGGDATLNHGGGGGGGASAVLLNGTLVASAGGGGGGSHGGAGGDGGEVGEPGLVGGTGHANAGGGGGTATSGGAGGTGSGGGLNGTAGGAGVGGAGGNSIDTQANGGGGDAGGGGGGGTFGGGGAGGGEATPDGGGAGGGGGSSMANLGDIETGVRDGDGRVDLNLLQAQCPGDLQIEKTVSDAAPELGDEVTYTLTATNNGPVDPDVGVVVTDNLPAGVTYISDDCGGVNADRWTWEIGDLPINSPETCNITVLVEEAGTWTNTATITGDNPDANPDNNEDSVDIEVPAPVFDLEIIKDAVVDEAARQITYTLTATNLGPDDTHEIVAVADLLPPQVAYVSDNCGGFLPSIQPEEGTLWGWLLGEMALDQTETCEITVDVLEAGEITNTAIVGGHSSPSVEPDLENNLDQVTVDFPPQVDLAIQKDGVLDETARQITYTLTVDNLGPDDATGVVVTDPLPAEVSYVSDTCDGVDAAPWTWEIGALAAGDTTTCEITVDVLGPGEITNVATVDGNEPDVDEENNEDDETLVVDPAADLAIVKSVSPLSVLVGDDVIYTLTVENLGPDDATGVVVADELPAEVTYVSDTCGGSDAPPWSWQLGDLATGDTATCQITVTAATPGEATNTATVEGDQDDLDPDNNTSVAAVTIDEVVVTTQPPPTTEPPDDELPTTGAAFTMDLLALGLTLTGLGTILVTVGRRGRRQRWGNP